MQKQYPWAPAVLAVLLAAAALLHSSFSVSADADTEDTPGILLGAHIPPVDPSFGPNRLYYWQEIAAFNQLVGRWHPIIMYYSDLTSGFNDYLLDQLRDKVSPSPVPYVQMDPVPNIRLWDVAWGVYDAQLRASADAVKRFGKPIIIGFAHEFNLSYSPFYGDPAAYIAAFRHVVTVFDQAGATNVQWLWPPNYKSDRPDLPASDYNLYYPGDAYVDWIAVYGFNWGNDFSKGSGWVEWDYLFDEFLRNTACRYPKPLMVGPTGSVDGPGLKAEWIANIYRALGSYDNVRAIVWFNDYAYNDPAAADFRVTVTSQYGAVPGPLPYTAAYQTAISSPTYLNEFPPYAELQPDGKSCFSLDAAPNTLLLEWSDQATAQMIMEQAPIFDTLVSVTVSGAPAGVSCTVVPSTVDPDASDPIIELRTTDGAPIGTYLLTFNATADGLVESTTLSLTVVQEAYRTFLPLVVYRTTP